MLLRYSHTRPLDPYEQLLAALVKRALQDARCNNERLAAEAAGWLQWFAPAVAERAGVVQEIATDNALSRR